MHGRWRRFRWLSTGLYLTLLTAVLVGSGTVTPLPDLAGTWTLNESLSQDPRSVLREAAGKVHPGEGEGGGRRGGRRGGRGGSGSPGGGAGEGGPRGERGEGTGADGDEHAGGPDLGLGAKELHIAGTGTDLTLAAAEGREQRVLHTDGRKRSEEQEGVGKITTQAQWKDGALEVVTKGPKGRTKTEIFEMTHDRKRLYVLVTLEGYGRMPTVTFRRVYDPEPAPAPAAAPRAPDLPDDDDDVAEDF